jgi:hypothetical protein
MPRKRIPSRVRNEIKKEKKRLKKLKISYPEIFRKCGNYPCCQAVNQNGNLCSRPAMTDKTYFQSLRCCYLCWQHALSYGVYGLLKIAKSASTMHMDMDEYCAYFPEECDEMIQTIKSF